MMQCCGFYPRARVAGMVRPNRIDSCVIPVNTDGRLPTLIKTIRSSERSGTLRLTYRARDDHGTVLAEVERRAGGRNVVSARPLEPGGHSIRTVSGSGAPPTPPVREARTEAIELGFGYKPAQSRC